MTITKEKLKIHIEQFPDEIEIDELIDRLFFIQKLENRIKESENDETVDDKVVKEEMQEWFKSNI